jgi:hypothetical protein
VNEVAWTPALKKKYAKFYDYPIPKIETSQKWVIVASNFGENCSISSEVFGGLPGIYAYPKPHGCFHFAQINYTAAATNCHGCRMVANGVVEAANKDLSALIPIPDSLVANAVSMISEVLFYMKISNSSQAPTWQNIEGYTRGMISIAYQASWTSLMNQWHGPPMETSGIRTPTPVLIVQVNHLRVGTWFGLNASLTVSGILLALLQKRCRNKTVRNPVLAALLLDTTAIFHQDTTGLCNATSLQKADESLWMQCQRRSSEGAIYNHPRIEIDVSAAPRSKSTSAKNQSMIESYEVER